MVSWREREARNEVRFREQNEWIVATSQSYGGDALMTLVCECGDGGCEQAIELNMAEYQAVRAVPIRFAIVPNHENPESEHVVSECARFAEVDKIEGWGLRIARATDPRTGDDSPVLLP